MSISYDSNVKKIIASLNKKEKLSLVAGGKGIVKGMNFFQSKIIKEQMSGRIGKKGLNVQTGALRRSWFIKSREMADNFISTLATSSVYAISHEKGLTIRPKTAKALYFKIGDKQIIAKQVKIPKRLNIIADFRKSGIRIISNEVIKEISKTLT